jgi:hypothetical protein
LLFEDLGMELLPIFRGGVSTGVTNIYNFKTTNETKDLFSQFDSGPGTINQLIIDERWQPELTDEINVVVRVLSDGPPRASLPSLVAEF